MVGLHAAFLIVAVLLFILAAIPVTEPWGGRLTNVGLAFFAASFLVP
jgi:hypothetical protein